MVTGEVEFAEGRLAEQLRWAADWIDEHREEEVVAIQFRRFDEADATSISLFIASHAPGTVVHDRIAYERDLAERNERQRQRLEGLMR